MFKSVLLLALILMSGFALVLDSNTQDRIPNTPIPITSLFEEDICTPPCWFGLVAGESTGEEVFAVLKSNREEFHSFRDFAADYYDFETETEIPVDGFYKFSWGTDPRPP
jgi:hypothetical protein